MDIETLRKEVNHRHGVNLGADDPIWASVTVNELVLEHFLGLMAKVVEQSQNQASGLAKQQEAAAKATAENLVTGAGRYIVEQMNAAGANIQDAWMRVLEQRIATAEKAAADAIAAKRVAIISAGGVAAVALMVLGGFVVKLLH